MSCINSTLPTLTPYKWLDDNKRLHLGLPLYEGMGWARSTGTPSIPWAERQTLLGDIGERMFVSSVLLPFDCNLIM